MIRHPNLARIAAASLIVAGGTCTIGAMAQVANYDGATQLLSLPSVSVGSTTYTGVTLRNIGNFTFALQDATQAPMAFPGAASYDGTSLRLPAVKVGSDTFLDVNLKDIGNLTFALQSATPLPADVRDAVSAFIARSEADWASAVPANGAARTANFDACYLGDGRTRAYIVNDIDSDLPAWLGANAYRVGLRLANVQVTALRDRTNPDGSARREIDLLYDVVYKDGTRARDVTLTAIAGSSSGTPRCSTPQNSSELRVFGNQQLVATSLRPRITRDERYSIASGNALNPDVQYRRDIRIQITDPMANATHVVVSGPGPKAQLNGQDVPFSWKMVSPFLMRAAPLLAGKSGNYVNFKDDDSFRYCGVSGTGVPVAVLADCATYGAPGDNWGWTTSTPNAAADSGFAAQGWVAGGMYRFDVYNDDGWKTVNGQSKATPIATYYAKLDGLPNTFVEMAGSGAIPSANDRFPKLKFGAQNAAGVLANALSATPAKLSAGWNALSILPNAQDWGLFQTWEYFQGAKTGNTGGAFWPALRSINYGYPGTAGTALSWPVLAKPADMAGKTYIEYMLYYSNRNNGLVQSRVLFQ